MKTLVVILSFLIVSTPAFGWGSPKPIPATPQAPIESVEVSDPGFIDVKANISGTIAQVARITNLAMGVEKVINSNEFKVRVLGAFYNGKLGFHDTNLTNKEVYEALRSGREINSTADFIWNIQVGVESARCSTLGWTYATVPGFWLNSCGLAKRSDAGLVGTLCHEYVHKLGFTHSSKWNALREFTVPYAVGTICAEIYQKHFN